MEAAMNSAAHEALVQLFAFQSIPTINQFLFLNVSRENLVSDALRELSSVSSSDLKKPLRVRLIFYYYNYIIFYNHIFISHFYLKYLFSY